MLLMKQNQTLLFAIKEEKQDGQKIKICNMINFNYAFLELHPYTTHKSNFVCLAFCWIV